jgi:Flp pilus assembly protein TadD
MFRLILLGLAYALVAACASTAPDGDQSSARPDATAASAAEPEPKAVERAFPDDSLYPLLVAEFALRRRAYDVALEQYLTQAPLLRDPGVSAHTTHLAQFMSREAEALEAVQLWVELEPDNVEANNTLAILLIRKGRTVEALPHMAQLAKQGEQPNYPALLSRFGELSSPARAELVQGINALAIEFPDDIQLLLTQAMIQAEFKQYEQALDKLQQVFQLEPDQPQAVLLEARILLNQKVPHPYARVERILATNPNDTQLRLQYARLLTGHDMPAARKQFEILSAQSPRDGDLLLSLALINRETGDDLAAKAYLRQLLALGQRTDEAYYYLGRIAEDAGDPEAALYQYKQVEDGRELLIATSRIGTILIDSGQLEQCQAWFQQLRQRQPQQLREQLYGMEADLLARAAELNIAMTLLNQALVELPESTTLRYARSMLAEQQGNLDLMESDLRHIIAREPDNATALNALGYTLANRTERYGEAHELISRALALQPDEPAILDSMGWVLYRTNRLEEAAEYLTRAYASFPDPEVAAHLGEVLWVSGDTKGAINIWQGALRKNPDNPVLQETLQRLGVTGLSDTPSGRPPSGGAVSDGETQPTSP